MISVISFWLFEMSSSEQTCFAYIIWRRAWRPWCLLMQVVQFPGDIAAINFTLDLWQFRHTDGIANICRSLNLKLTDALIVVLFPDLATVFVQLFFSTCLWLLKVVTDFAVRFLCHPIAKSVVYFRCTIIGILFQFSGFRHWVLWIHDQWFELH